MDTELDGFWFAKFESSRTDSSNTSRGTASTLQAKPNYKSGINMTINDAFNAAIAFNSALNSHMVKNTEWGAVAYLAHSQYGRKKKRNHIV